jgi:hypothetical protein
MRRRMLESQQSHPEHTDGDDEHESDNDCESDDEHEHEHESCVAES